MRCDNEMCGQEGLCETCAQEAHRLESEALASLDRVEEWEEIEAFARLRW
jgi:hypothetical protein